MTVTQAVPGSFRDPSGRVYQVEGRIFRSVSPQFAAEFEFVESTGLIKKLAAAGSLLPAEQVEAGILGPLDEAAKYVLEIPCLPFISFPYEWPFSALKAAALLHLEIHLTALDCGVTMSDASAYNVQFLGARPVFIDHLSFRRYRNGEMWVGHRQFCEQFLNPLLLRALFGISHNAWYRGSPEGITAEELSRFLKWRHYLSWNIFTHVVLQSFFQRAARNKRVELEKGNVPASAFPLLSFRRMLKKLHAWISQLHPADIGRTLWRDYAKTQSYSPQEAEIKRRFIIEFARQTKPRLLWDFGCNTGDYAKAVLEAGGQYVVGFDFDQGALEAGFARARDEHLNLQTLFMDAANPTPSQGWRGQERQSLPARASADAILALALVHHLAIGHNIPFGQVLDWIVDLAPRGVIEFVPKGDPMVQELLRLREDIFPDYTEAFFVQRIATRAELIKTANVTSSGRLLLWYERR